MSGKDRAHQNKEYMSGVHDITGRLNLNCAVVLSVNAVDYENKFKNDFFFEECLRLLPLNNGVLNKKFLPDQITILVNRLLQLWGCKLALESTTPVTKVEFSRGPYGKPRLHDHHPNITFSMTNGYMKSSMIVTKDAFVDVGIDIANIADYCGDQELFRDILHEEEFKYLADPLKSAQQKAQFFARMWSFKESYTKFTGTGLNCDLSKIYVAHIDPSAKVITRTMQMDNHAQEMTFVSKWIDKESVLTVCFPSDSNIASQAIDFLDVDIMDIITVLSNA